jgi:hypothetical protein
VTGGRFIEEMTNLIGVILSGGVAPFATLESKDPFISAKN